MGFSGSLKRARQEQQGVPMSFRVRDPRPKPTIQDSLRFLATMKRELAGELDKYEEYEAILREFKAGRINIAGVVDHVKVLLAGHPDLIRAFNEFLPWDYIRSHGPAMGSSI